MARFDIVQGSPLEYRGDILDMWRRLLPGTPEGRLDWLMEGNPAGPAVWFMAFDRSTRRLAGVLSVIPRSVYHDGRALRAGILGDFMVLEEYRAFGPGVLLPRHVTKNRETLGFDFFYTVPNENAQKSIEAAGFDSRWAVRTLAKPVSVRPYLLRYLPRAAVKAAAPVADLAIRAVSPESYTGNAYEATVGDPISGSFDDMWEKARRNTPGLLGDRSSKYLEWKHRRNPLGPLTSIVLRKRGGDAVVGYLFYRIDGPRLSVADLLLADQDGLRPLVRSATTIARQHACQAIYIKTGDAVILSRLPRLLFLDARADNAVLSFGLESRPAQWHFFEADQST